jgi:hypothetical protein
VSRAARISGSSTLDPVLVTEVDSEYPDSRMGGKFGVADSRSFGSLFKRTDGDNMPRPTAESHVNDLE